MTALALLLAPPLASILSSLQEPTPPGCVSLAFDGFDDCVVVPFDDEFVSPAFTASAWIRVDPSLLSSQNYIIGVGEDPNSDIQAWGIYVSSGGDLWYGTEASFSAQPTLLSSGTAVADGAWHHVAVTGAPGDGIAMWVDGLLAADYPSAPTVVTSVEQSLTIGCIFALNGPAQFQPPTHFYPGRIDELTYWTRRLSTSEVAMLSQGVLPSDSSGLEAYWKLDEGVGQVVSDETNGDDGLLGGDAAIQGTDPEWKSFPIEVAPTVNVRLGTPPNPLALSGGSPASPVLGAIWEPVIDHTSFAPDASADVLVIGFAPANATIPGVGTLLVETTGLVFVGPVTPGVTFQVPVPDDCAFVGFPVFVQGASLTPAGFEATNALDVTIGTP